LHGTFTAVSGQYGYLVKVATPPACLRQITIVTRFQMNPRALPALATGTNELTYKAGPSQERWPVPVVVSRMEQFADRAENLRYVSEQAQGFLAAPNAAPAEVTFKLAAPDSVPISGFDAGGRFLDIRNREAPDKFTAEVRQTAYESPVPPASRSATLAWSVAPDGPYTELWRYTPDLKWKDGIPIDRTLLWPEVFRTVRSLPAGTRQVYVRYRLSGVALDSLRLAVVAPSDQRSPLLEITHLWHEGAAARSHVERIPEPWRERPYKVQTGGGGITNDAVIFYCPPPQP
jgi:hypothetical protein